MLHFFWEKLHFDSAQCWIFDRLLFFGGGGATELRRKFRTLRGCPLCKGMQRIRAVTPQHGAFQSPFWGWVCSLVFPFNFQCSWSDGFERALGVDSVAEGILHQPWGQGMHCLKSEASVGEMVQWVAPADRKRAVISWCLIFFCENWLLHTHQCVSPGSYVIYFPSVRLPLQKRCDKCFSCNHFKWLQWLKW